MNTEQTSKNSYTEMRMIMKDTVRDSNKGS